MMEVSQIHEDAPSPRQVDLLGQRVQRLEDAVAALQDTRQLEERVLERVRHSAPVAGPASLIIDAGRHLLPAALESLHAPMNGMDDPARATARPSWWLLDLYAEVRAVFWMFFDARYRLTWTARLVPAGLLFVFLFSWLFLSPFFLIGALLDKVVDVVVIVTAYKVLSREARRYRLLVPDFPVRRST